jgi:hypothetical protein
MNGQGKSNFFIFVVQAYFKVLTSSHLNQAKEVLWNPTPEVRAKRLQRLTVPMELQGQWESEKLWQHVTKSIRACDQVSSLIFLFYFIF